jgi:hypothetical protein
LRTVVCVWCAWRRRDYPHRGVLRLRQEASPDKSEAGQTAVWPRLLGLALRAIWPPPFASLRAPKRTPRVPLEKDNGALPFSRIPEMCFECRQGEDVPSISGRARVRPGRLLKTIVGLRPQEHRTCERRNAVSGRNPFGVTTDGTDYTDGSDRSVRSARRSLALQGIDGARGCAER